MNRMIETAIAIAAMTFVGAAGAASARETGQDQMTVRVGDLNIRTHEGATVALRRIKSAASQFCGPQPVFLSEIAAHKRCMKDMTGKAVAKLDAPMVTALYGEASPIQLAQSEPAAR